MMPVSYKRMFWTFNPRTHAWQYDVASVSISPPSKNISHPPLTYPPTPLRPDTRPRLDADGIVSCFEEQFGDFLHVIASLGETRHVKDLSDFARHGYLTFGAVVDRNKPEILAYFPSTPSPARFYGSKNANVQASYSASVPSRVDLSFRNTDCNRVHLDFSLRLPDLLSCRTAYLSQSVPFGEDCDDPLNDLVFIDEVRFSLVGTFQSNPTSSTTPAYLFVPPIPVEVVNNVYCIRYPLPNTLFFWCSDPDGQDVICEENWKAYGIPQLEIFTWMGSSWYGDRYATVRDHLEKKSCALDGRQYAREHNYPELAYGDPHSPRITVVEEPDIPEDIDGFSERSEHQDDANDIGLIPLDQPSSEALETRCIEANHIETSTSLSNKDDQEGPKARSIHDLAPSRRSSQSYSNEYQPPAWPRAIYELFVLAWSIAVVILSVGVDRVTRVVGRTRP
ncbi:hypothetical protein PM082_022827 [Marasmius tenuissimus]|nr:hypothetical protein PM082_022827 [Marasmius tenuissimus]